MSANTVSGNTLFEQVVTALLEGEILCAVRYESLHNYLAIPGNVDKVNEYLSRLNRRARMTGSQDAWLCAYIDLDTPGARESVRQQFNEVANHLEALVGWLRLSRNAGTHDRPLIPGDYISEADLLKKIEQAPDLAQSLATITERGMFKSQNSTAKGQLGHIMTRLVEHGYLDRQSGTGTVYKATGKWSWLYDVMGFIQQHEQLETEPEDVQMSMH